MLHSTVKLIIDAEGGFMGDGKGERPRTAAEEASDKELADLLMGRPQRRPPTRPTPELKPTGPATDAIEKMDAAIDEHRKGRETKG